MALSAQALVGILILITMIVGLMVLTYVVWFRWEWFVEFTIGINRDNPLFKHYEGFYKSGLGKWLTRILLPFVLLLLVTLLSLTLYATSMGPEIR